MGRDGRDVRDASDATLVFAIARFQQDALAEAYRRHAGAVFALANRVTGEAAMAEETTQDVFLRLWNSPDRFDPERGTLRSFLLAQAHSRAVDAVRSESARKQREDKQVRETAEAGYDVEREVWDLAVADSVKAAVSDLPAEERRAIELAYFGGHSYRDVATMLAQPEGTVKTRIRNGLRRMRSSLVAAGLVEQ